MTPKEAAMEMEKRIPGQTYACDESYWSPDTPTNNVCRIAYNFKHDTCSIVYTSSFEDALKLVDKDLLHQSILFKQFKGERK